MKIHVLFKTPDAVEYALEGVSDDDREKVENFLSEFIEYGESVTLEFDTEKKTAQVKKRK